MGSSFKKLSLQDCKKLNINTITNFGLGFLNRIYKVGFLNKSDNDKIKNAQLITLRKGNEAKDVLSEDLITTDKLVDEIHNCKSSKALRTKIVKKIANAADRGMKKAKTLKISMVLMISVNFLIIM